MFYTDRLLGQTVGQDLKILCMLSGCSWVKVKMKIQSQRCWGRGHLEKKRDDVKRKICFNASGVMNLLVPRAAGKGHLGNSLLCPHRVRGLLSCGSCRQPRALPGCGAQLHVEPLLGTARGCLRGQILSWRDSNPFTFQGTQSDKCEYKSTAKPTDSCPVCQCYRVYTGVHDKFKCCSANEAGIWFQISCTLHLINNILGQKKMNYSKSKNSRYSMEFFLIRLIFFNSCSVLILCEMLDLQKRGVCMVGILPYNHCSFMV